MILLSPAKSLDLERKLHSKPETSTITFKSESKKLVSKLKKYNTKKLEVLYKVSPEIASINYDRFQQWEEPLIENQNIKSCIEMFNGEAYKGLDPETFTVEDFHYAQENLRILSGLYGILKPLDLIYPYRLEMGTKFQIDTKANNLYQFWTDKITNYIKKEKPNFILNLASNEYNKAVDFKKLKIKTITPIFKDFKNGEYKIIMMYAKHARGEMTRFCIKNKIDNIEDLKHYNENGYYFNEKESNESNWVFYRD
jgi:cytoplasmic iron level regulating protein YaaA (DUF328/UPF0246 family)